eukprot:gnl/MRDRNA2_/MRDRNA2_145160_c0_seq1.p1 gnl/MRDRNA2_/MRDRNA2_145160_c0~~gnl/MRDRNA2_/MRDRNA2_145160_c0_seq1.p1  ORF type:complete len:507 (-),score=95.19 gnl/MRDRNA2_/MRDRNA2_145160_c0_seq1:164-1684(-)
MSEPVDNPWDDISEGDDEQCKIGLLDRAVQEVTCNAIGQDGVYVECNFMHAERTRLLRDKISRRGQVLTFDPQGHCAGQIASDLQHQIIQQDVLESKLPSIAGALVDAGSSFTSKSVNADVLQWLRTVSPAELAWVIHEYSEENDALLAERIAEIICNSHFRTSAEFSQVVSSARGKSCDRHLPKMVLEAIHCWLTQEVENLQITLDVIFERLQYGGRCAVLCYKKRETSAMRCFLRNHEEPDSFSCMDMRRLQELYPLLASNTQYAIRLVRKTHMKPSEFSDEKQILPKGTALLLLEKVHRRIASIPDSLSARPIRSYFREPALLPEFTTNRSWLNERSKEPERNARLDEDPVSNARIEEPAHILRLEQDPVINARREESARNLRLEESPVLNAWLGGAVDSPPIEEVAAASDLPETTQVNSLPEGTSEEELNDMMGSAPVLRKGLALEDFSTPIEGYLNLRRDDEICIIHIGTEENEVGWLYGYKSDELRTHGWLRATSFGEAL